MSKVSSKATAGYFALAGLVAAAGMFTAFLFVEPPPPSKFVLATGSEVGAYFRFGTGYARELGAKGLSLDVRSSAGSVENLDLLKDPASGVDLAIIQGGIIDTPVPGLVALASLFREPVWLFYRGEIRKRLTEFAGSRIAVGAEGSGTRALALRLLDANEVTAANAELLALASADSLEALLGGEIAAGFFVSAPESAVIQRLLQSDELRLFSFERAGAYAQRLPFLSSVVLHEGAIDFARNLPSRDVTLIAPAATLAAREDFHPALVAPVLEAVTAVHRAGNIFDRAGEFPAGDYLDLPLEDSARRFLSSGPPFLQRFLPFWVANLLDRLVVLAIPLLTLILPLVRILPPFYRWRMRNKVNRIYGRLARLEHHQASGKVTSAAALKQLAELARKAGEISLPPAYVNEVYGLRFHLDRARATLEADSNQSGP